MLKPFREERTIGQQRRGRGFIPRLLLAARWLEDFGFKEGQVVSIRRKQGEIGIRRVK